MAIIKCLGCGKEISHKSEKCVHCGRLVELHDNASEFPISICPECKKNITEMTDLCPNCGCPLDLNSPMICKINGVDYDLSYFYHTIVKLDKDDMSGTGKILVELRKFTDVFDYPVLMQEIWKTKAVPKTFESKSFEKVVAEEKKRIPKIYCKYCGSDNVRKLGPFEKLAVQCIGKEWHCKKCNSDF